MGNIGVVAWGRDGRLVGPGESGDDSVEVGIWPVLKAKGVCGCEQATSEA